MRNSARILNKPDAGPLNPECPAKCFKWVLWSLVCTSMISGVFVTQGSEYENCTSIQSELDKHPEKLKEVFPRTPTFSSDKIVWPLEIPRGYLLWGNKHVYRVCLSFCSYHWIRNLSLRSSFISFNELNWSLRMFSNELPIESAILTTWDRNHEADLNDSRHQRIIVYFRLSSEAIVGINPKVTVELRIDETPCTSNNPEKLITMKYKNCISKSPLRFVQGVAEELITHVYTPSQLGVEDSFCLNDKISFAYPGKGDFSVQLISYEEWVGRKIESNNLKNLEVYYRIDCFSFLPTPYFTETDRSGFQRLGTQFTMYLPEDCKAAGFTLTIGVGNIISADDQKLKLSWKIIRHSPVDPFYSSRSFLSWLVAGLVVFGCLVFMIIFLRFQNEAQNQTASKNSKMSSTSKSLDCYQFELAMPLFQFDSLSQLEASKINHLQAAGLLKLPDSCAICLERFKPACVVRRIRVCGHVLHSECLAKWLEINESCPLCKIEINLYSLLEIELQSHAKVQHIMVNTTEYAS